MPSWLQFLLPFTGVLVLLFLLMLAIERYGVWGRLSRALPVGEGQVVPSRPIFIYSVRIGLEGYSAFSSIRVNSHGLVLRPIFPYSLVFDAIHLSRADIHAVRFKDERPNTSSVCLSTGEELSFFGPGVGNALKEFDSLARHR